MQRTHINRFSCLTLLLGLFCSLFIQGLARADISGVTYTNANVFGTVVKLQFTTPADNLLELNAGSDRNTLYPASAYQQDVIQGLKITSGNEPCTASFLGVGRLSASQSYQYELKYQCVSDIQANGLAFEYTLFDHVNQIHENFLDVHVTNSLGKDLDENSNIELDEGVGKQKWDLVLTNLRGYKASGPNARVTTIDVAGNESDLESASTDRIYRIDFGAANTTNVFASAYRYLELGIKHVLAGLDHLLFVLCLIVLPLSRKDIILAITCFSFGHSITLCLASLGLVSMNILLVEILIALSIVFCALVNIANLWRKTPNLSPLGRQAFAMIFAFGMVHGFGFASVLNDIGLPVYDRFISLLSFNVGVEFGQLLVVLCALPLLFMLWRSARYRSIAIGLMSVTTMVASVWTFERLQPMFS